MPRHPPNALISLDRSHCLCSSLVDVPKGRDEPDYLLQSSPRHDAINVFDATLFAGTPVHSRVTSLRPASRDKSDDARSGNINPVHPVRSTPESANNRRTIEQASFLPPTPQLLRPARPSKFHRDWARTFKTAIKPSKTPGSFQTYLLFTMHAEHATNLSRSQNLYFSRRHNRHRHLNTKSDQSRPIDMVELSGIEPLTPCLQSRCSPS